MEPKICNRGDFLESLNDHLLSEIFMKLPIKELCRIRRVRKSWNSLISSSFFITQHRSASNSDVGNSYFLWNYSSHETNLAFSYALYDPRVPLVDQYPTFRRDPFRIRSLLQGRPNRPFHLVDVNHGVACLAHRDSVVLWNPAIDKHVEIPLSPSNVATLNAVGFGYDGSKQYSYGFKVVTIRGVARGHSFDVFSTREGGRRWRSVALGQIEIDRFITKEGCFSNGTIYWIVSRYLDDGSPKKYMLMFDCEREEFKMMELPNQFNRCAIRWTWLLNYRGVLSIFVMFGLLEPEMWEMEEGGYNIATMKWKKSRVQEDLIRIVDDQVEQYEVGRLSQISKTSTARLEKLRLKQPLNGYVFEETMFLMDLKSP